MVLRKRFRKITKFRSESAGILECAEALQKILNFKGWNQFNTKKGREFTSLHSDQREMVKRKANVSIDEWLEGGVSLQRPIKPILWQPKRDQSHPTYQLPRWYPNRYWLD